MITVLIITMYMLTALTARIIRDLIAIVAFCVLFIVIDTISYSEIFKGLDSPVYYMMFAGIYCLSTSVLIANNYKLITILASFSVVAFNVVAAIDAIIYPQTQTVFNAYYGYFVMGVHTLVCLSFMDWRGITRSVSDAVSNLFNSISFDHNSKRVKAGYNTHNGRS